MAENPETYLPRGTCTKQETQESLLSCGVQCSGSFPHLVGVSLAHLPPWRSVPSGSRSCYLALLSFLGFDLCIPIQEEHLLINYIPCWEFCKSEAILGSEQCWQQQGHLLVPRLSTESVLHLDLGPCSAHPLFPWWSWCQVYQKAAVTNSFPNIVCKQE